MHIFSDLQSYICTHPDCEDSFKTFPTRDIWANHEFQKHLILAKLRCFTCNATFESLPKSDFVNHLKTDHQIQFNCHSLSAVMTEARELTLSPDYESHPCALCLKSGWRTTKEYATHVGQHLEEISLASLPGYEDKSDEDESTSTTSSGVDAHACSDASSDETGLDGTYDGGQSERGTFEYPRQRIPILS
ncbi:hypothetical protein N7540_002146 [Penicillium herquei]|nr:hypothetical protein N7540_002146 [Penicillium herquei]